VDRVYAAACARGSGLRVEAEEREGAALHRAADRALDARHRAGAGPAAGAVADRAEHRGVDDDLAGRAERGLRERDVDADERVLAAAHARGRPARRTAAGGGLEERLEDVAEPEPGAGTGHPGHR